MYISIYIKISTWITKSRGYGASTLMIKLWLSHVNMENLLWKNENALSKYVKLQKPKSWHRFEESNTVTEQDSTETGPSAHLVHVTKLAFWPCHICLHLAPEPSKPFLGLLNVLIVSISSGSSFQIQTPSEWKICPWGPSEISHHNPMPSSFKMLWGEIYPSPSWSCTPQ